MAIDYTTLKLIHVSAVALSGSGFLARGAGALRGARWVRSRAARTLPHLIDTILLLSAIGMLWVAHLWPWPVLWLRAKIIGLVCYILLGAIAIRGLRRRAERLQPASTPQTAPAGRPAARAVPAIAWVLAILVFVYIVSVALTKSPWGGFVLFMQ